MCHLNHSVYKLKVNLNCMKTRKKQVNSFYSEETIIEGQRFYDLIIIVIYQLTVKIKIYKKRNLRSNKIAQISFTRISIKRIIF